MRPGDMRALARYALGLRGYLRHPLDIEECRRRVRYRLERREEAFLGLAERAIYANPRSPYLTLLRHLGIELGDLSRLVGEHGVEGALALLHAAGVHVTIDEYRGRQPISRSGLELEVGPGDFDNPLLLRYYDARTGGSRSAGTRTHIDLDLLAHEAAYWALALAGFGVEDAPYALWRPVPPAGAGLKALLRRAKLGRPSDAWFSQYERPATLKHRLLTSYTVRASRLWGVPLPQPEHVPLEGAARVARWLAERAHSGTPALLDTNWSAAVRACLAAQESGLDISGTFFRVGGEPATAARARAIEATGSRFAAHYSMGEAGSVGIACAERRALDEVHLLSDKLAVIQRPRRVGEVTVAAFHITTLLPSCPKILLNLDTGDHGTLSERRCGCPLGEIGLTARAHGIASYEKLTSEGMNFIGSDLAWLVEEALPARLGGDLSDYQLVEEADGPLPRVSVVISPAVGDLDEEQVVRTVLESLSALGEPQRLMADAWRQGGTLRVVRREPFATSGAKVQPLHLLRRSGQE